MDVDIPFFSLLFAAAFLYSTAGHGGASGYLALMALFGFAPAEMKPTALALNILVSSLAFWKYYSNGHFKPAIFLPLAIASVPFAFWGGTISLETVWYKKILGVFLLFTVARFLFFSPNDTQPARNPVLLQSAFIGASIGMLSGLIGIGGGIILSPVLLLLGWTNQKQTAAISALFILVNSIAGLAGHFSKELAFSALLPTSMVVVLLGGFAGAHTGAVLLKERQVQYVLSFVLLLAAAKLIFTPP